MTFDKALKIDSSREEAYEGLADVYVAMGDYDKAMDNLSDGYRETDSRSLQKG